MPNEMTTPRPKVLLVDDEPNVTQALKAAFRRQPFDVIMAGSGKEAIEILSREPIDLIVTDEMMPGMQGSDLLVHVRRISPDTVSIVLTGQANMDSALRAINEGRAFRFLQKPFPPAQLADLICEGLATRNGKKPKATPEAKAISELEGHFPGLTQVARDADGGIQLDEDDGDISHMLGELAAQPAK
jgi:two-component system probable response regulator PhcQ